MLNVVCVFDCQLFSLGVGQIVAHLVKVLVKYDVMCEVRDIALDRRVEDALVQLLTYTSIIRHGEP